MSHPITEESLLAAGYKKCAIPIGGESADSFYYKNVKWIAGDVKYSIGVYHYDLSKYTPDKPDGYKVEGRFQKKDGNHFMVEDFAVCAIEEHESFFEGVWGNLDCTDYLEVG